MTDEREKLDRVEVTCVVDDMKTTGHVVRRDLEKSERMKRALRSLGILWAVAFITVFVPVLHFVLVPLFLLGGIVFAVTTWLEKGEVLGGEVACPNCRHVIHLEKEAESWPKTLRCTNCSYTLKIERGL